MSLSLLNAQETAFVAECLRASVEGGFFPEWEFPILFGVTRTEVREVLDAFPDVDENDETVYLAINNSMANLIGYPHGQDATWGQYLSATRGQLEAIHSKWRSDFRLRRNLPQ